MTAGLGAATAAALGLASIYLSFPGRTLALGELMAGVVFLASIASYVLHRPAARQAVWPR